jgi:hypothetical protein
MNHAPQKPQILTRKSFSTSESRAVWNGMDNLHGMTAQLRAVIPCSSTKTTEVAEAGCLTLKVFLTAVRIVVKV